MLSETSIKAIKPTSKHQMLADRDGLYLRVHPSGKKQFLFRSRVGGKAKYKILGDYPKLSLSAARKKTVELQDSATTMTLDKVFELFYKHVSTRYVKPEMVKSKYEANVQKHLGTRAIENISRADISDVLQKIIDRGSPVMANRVLADLKKMFTFAVERGFIDNNVLTPLTRKAVGGKEEARSRVLTDDEIKAFIQELLAPRLDYRTRACLALCLLTGQRVSEVMQIDPSAIWWEQKEDNKSRRAHRVYLSVQARSILKFVRPPFASDHRTMSRALRRLEYTFTPHDLRRTMATKLSDMGVAPHVVEKMLNHKMSGVMDVYNRSEYLNERKAAWRLWGCYLAAIRRGVTRNRPPSVPSSRVYLPSLGT